MAGMGTSSLDLRTVSAMANGPLGVEYGTYVYNMTLAPGAPAAIAAMFPESVDHSQIGEFFSAIRLRAPPSTDRLADKQYNRELGCVARMCP